MLPDAMVTRTRFRAVLTALGLYVLAGLVIAYFGMHAYSGQRGLRAKEDLALQMTELTAELDKLKAQRSELERRVALLRPEGVEPDMLDERARDLLDYVHARDLVLLGKPAAGPREAVAAAR